MIIAPTVPPLAARCSTSAIGWDGSFVIVRIEFTPHVGNKDGWTTIWEAPKWSFLARPN